MTGEGQLVPPRARHRESVPPTSLANIGLIASYKIRVTRIMKHYFTILREQPGASSDMSPQSSMPSHTCDERTQREVPEHA